MEGDRPLENAGKAAVNDPSDLLRKAGNDHLAHLRKEEANALKVESAHTDRRLKAEKGHIDLHNRAGAEGDRTVKTVAGHKEIGAGEENGVDRQG